MSRLTTRVERDLREIAAGADPSPDAWEKIVARLGGDAEPEVALVLAPDAGRSKRPVRIAVAAAAALVLIAGSIAVLSTAEPDAETNPPVAPPSTATGGDATIPPAAPSFVGTWVSIDTDGSSQTMEIFRSSGEDYEIVVRDAFASAACAGAAATMTGTGRLASDERLIIAQPELTCDDGTTPAIGPPPQAELANFAFDRDPEADELTDAFGVVWQRPGSDDGSLPTGSVPSSATSGGMWPQSTLDEVEAAQELADAGDPAYTWQLDAEFASDSDPWGAEIFARFIEERLGWEEFISGGSFDSGYMGDGDASFAGLLFVRCAPGETNPLSPLYAQAPSAIRGCAPTIDELTYETVAFTASQPGRQGPSGIWVVQKWELLQTKSDPRTLWGLIYESNHGEFQVGQVTPPADAEVAEVLQSFLQARVEGQGAERYLLREPEGSWAEDREVPLLYATTTGAPFVRSEIQRVQGAVWPQGVMEYKVRLFAEGETVVEQFFHVIPHDGQVLLAYGYPSNGVPTTENGQSVAMPYSFLDGGVTLAAAPPWYGQSGSNQPNVLRFGCESYGSNTGPGRCSVRAQVVISADPMPVETGCPNGPAPVDAAALASSVMADPAFETTGTVPVRIAGVDVLQIEGVVTAQEDWFSCYPMWFNEGTPGRFRMRLYLIDQPGESAQVLTIAIIGPETNFEGVLEQVAPIIDSLQFNTD